VIGSAEIFFFSDELQKLAGMPAPQPQQPQEPKKKNLLTRHAGKGTLLATGIAGLAALKNPAAAGKYLTKAKEIATKPVQSLKAGWREGASNIRSGPGASSAASKRVEHMKDVFTDAQEGTLRNVAALDNPDSLRGKGWLSMGVRQADGLQLDKGLKSQVDDVVSRLKAGEMVPEEQLAGLYSQIQEAGKAQGLTPSALNFSISNPYLLGERGLIAGMGTIGGAAGGASSTDPETGRKRGVAERLARAGTGAFLGASTAPLMMGRGMGLARSNLLTGNTGKGTSMLSQKTVLPAAASVPVMAAAGMATDVAGSGGALVDKAFGQKQ
jgi:hypothetical protein